MSTDSPKAAPSASSPPIHRGVRVFTYPKIIFLMPTFLAAIVCGIGMLVTGNEVEDPAKLAANQPAIAAPAETAKSETPASTAPRSPVRFGSAQNFMATAFLVVFGLNLIILAFDFPRFTVIALLLAIIAGGFFILWLNVYFDLLPPIVRLLEHVYVVANAGFYFAVATIIGLTFLVVAITRYLDYWEILPNEILHNHGPFSDLERFPTSNLKFDKEIPDILEYALLRSGRLVLHVTGQTRAIVLDNVLWINSKEMELKKLLSRMEVRITTDQETMNEQM
jgi:hypothetical protein